MKRSAMWKILLVVLALGAIILAGIFIQKPKDGSVIPAATLGLKQEVSSEVSPQKHSEYIEIIDSCGPYFEEACVNARSGPGITYTAVSQLRTGIVLKVAEKVTDTTGQIWYKIAFDEWLRYPERVSGGWYVSGTFVREFSDQGDQEVPPGTKAGNQRITIDLSDQMLYAYDGNTLFMKAPVSTGLDLTPTPRGTFSIFRKTPTRYMQGPIPEISDQYYDLPGVPWDMYFTEQGAAIHGAYWHTDFGKTHSHGCVNLSLENAHTLYDWAQLGTKVTVQD